jgi:hypothetical protein
VSGPVEGGADTGETEHGERGFGPVGAQRLPPSGLFAGFRRAQEGGLLGEQPKYRRPSDDPGQQPSRKHGIPFATFS